MTWSIDPGAARGVLGRVLAHTADVDTAADSTATAFADAKSAAVHAPATNAALSVVAADPLLMGLAAARRYIQDVVAVVDSVISTYEAGDLEMAAETQRMIPGEPR
ncbi:MAG: DUF6507 family protein [Microbacterium sp.]